MKQQKQIDPCFPQMSKALSQTRMLEAFQKNLVGAPKAGGGGFLIHSCQIGEQRYKPGKSCVVNYRIEILNTATQALREQILCARLCKTGEGPSEFKDASRKTLFKPENLPPILYLPDLEMVLWTFPNDRKLTHLPKMLELSFLCEDLPQRLPSLNLQSSNHLMDIKAQVIHYLPERSCVIRYILDLENCETGEVRSLVVFGKIYPDDSGQTVYSIMKQLSSQLGDLRVARPLAYDADLNVLWQSELSGRPFRAEEIKALHCDKVMEEMAATVAALHRSKLEGVSHFKVSDILNLLKETRDVVGKTHPQWANRMGSLVQTLLTRSEEIGLGTVPITPIHGDLKIGNMLIDAGKVALIDMDCVRLGDPLCDLGSFIANFYYNGILTESDENHTRWLVEKFCRVYSEQVEWEVSEARLHWHIASAFLYEIIRRSIRQGSERRLKYIDQYLALSERYCFQNLSNQDGLGRDQG